MPRKDRPLIDIFQTGHAPTSTRTRARDPRYQRHSNKLTAARRAVVESRRNPQKRRKLRSDKAGTELLTREPPLSPDFAREFVKLLHAGIPSLDALGYFAPAHFASLSINSRKEWLSRWQNSPIMAKAASAFAGGNWQDLDKDARLQLALDKHMAELAYFLYTADYAKSEGLDYKKLTDARTAIMQMMSEGEGDTDTPFMRAMRELMEGKVADALGKPIMPAVPRTSTSTVQES